MKYDYRELWRWATVLKRFAVSAGNTMGIVDAQVLSNVFPTGCTCTALRGPANLAFGRAAQRTPLMFERR